MDLNIVNNYIKDLTPLYEMKQLKRLWIKNYNKHGMLRPWEPVEALRNALPDTYIDNESTSTAGGWRNHPHYDTLYRMFRTTVYEPFEDSWPMDGTETEAGPVQDEADSAEKPQIVVVPAKHWPSAFPEQTEKITKKRYDDVGGSTEGGIWKFFRDAIKNKTHYDNIFIFSDQQAGTGGLYGTTEDLKEYQDQGFSCKGNRYINVYKLILDYRKYVNKKVNVFSVQTAGYNNILIPQMSYRCAMLTGWTGKEIPFAAEYIRQWDEIESKNLENWILTVMMQDKSYFWIFWKTWPQCNLR